MSYRPIPGAWPGDEHGIRSGAPVSSRQALYLVALQDWLWACSHAPIHIALTSNTTTDGGLTDAEFDSVTPKRVVVELPPYTRWVWWWALASGDGSVTIQRNGEANWHRVSVNTGRTADATAANAQWHPVEVSQSTGANLAEGIDCTAVVSAAPVEINLDLYPTDCVVYGIALFPQRLTGASTAEMISA